MFKADFELCMILKDGNISHCDKKELNKYVSQGYEFVKYVDTRPGRI